MISEEGLKLIGRLRGRRDMNKRTSEIHPDLEVRIAAAARVQAFETAILDVEMLLRSGESVTR